MNVSALSHLVKLVNVSHKSEAKVISFLYQILAILETVNFEPQLVKQKNTVILSAVS